MSRPREAAQYARAAAQAIGQGGDVRQMVGQAVGQYAGQAAGQYAGQVAEQFVGQAAGNTGSGGSAADKGFALNPSDFMAARDQGSSLGTVIEARSAPLNEAGEIVNRSFGGNGPNGEPVHVISPVVIPKGTTARVVVPLVVLAGLGLVGLVATGLPEGPGCCSARTTGPCWCWPRRSCGGAGAWSWCPRAARP